MTAPSPFLDVPPFPTNRYAPLADRLKVLLATRNDVVFVQAEAILALEATASSLGRPELVALNIVTSSYGSYFGGWLRRAGAEVHEVAADAGRPVSVAAVLAALETLPRVDLVAVVHAETSSGILNPLPQIAEAVRARGALLVVDAVASVGGHELDVDTLGIDVCVIGPQKALGGPAGLSAVSVSARTWDQMEKSRHQGPYVPSGLSLLDLKQTWLDRGRGVVPGMPSALEFWALDAALDRVEAETLPQLIVRHRLAAEATRGGLIALGVGLWAPQTAEASNLVTTTSVAPGLDPAAVIASSRRLGGMVSPGFGPAGDRLLRLDHTGTNADPASVIANVVAYGTALRQLSAKVAVDKAAETVAQTLGIVGASKRSSATHVPPLR